MSIKKSVANQELKSLLGFMIRACCLKVTFLRWSHLCKHRWLECPLWMWHLSKPRDTGHAAPLSGLNHAPVLINIKGGWCSSVYWWILGEWVSLTVTVRVISLWRWLKNNFGFRIIISLAKWGRNQTGQGRKFVNLLFWWKAVIKGSYKEENRPLFFFKSVWDIWGAEEALKKGTADKTSFLLFHWVPGMSPPLSLSSLSVWLSVYMYKETVWWCTPGE